LRSYPSDSSNPCVAEVERLVAYSHTVVPFAPVGRDGEGHAAAPLGRGRRPVQSVHVPKDNGTNGVGAWSWRGRSSLPAPSNKRCEQDDHPLAPVAPKG